MAIDSHIDVVYVGTILPAHFKTVEMLLYAGKHVECEKPMGMSPSHTRHLIELARENDIFLMEAVWSRMFPCYARLKDLLQQGAIGDVRNVSMTFGQKNNHVPGARLAAFDRGGGTVLDWGVYCIQLALFVYGAERPSKIAATTVGINEDGVDLGVDVTLTFGEKGEAKFSTDLRVDLPCEAVIVGSRGKVTLCAPFWSPTRLQLVTEGAHTKEDTFPLPAETGRMIYRNSEGLLYEADEIRVCLLAGKGECAKFTHREMELVAEIQYEINKQIGSKYAQQ